MEAYWLAAKKGKIGEIYNIAGSDTISVGKYLEKLISLSNTKIHTKLDKKLLRPVDIDLQIANTKKFKLHTNWKPSVSFETSVQNLLNECRHIVSLKK